MNGYLIPANSKKGLLILNIFRPKDIAIFGAGIFISLILLTIFNTTNIILIILLLLPALITGFLVIPIPNYHNFLGAIESIMSYYLNRRTYKWKGWCFYERIVQEQSNSN